MPREQARQTWLLARIKTVRLMLPTAALVTVVSFVTPTTTFATIEVKECHNSHDETGYKAGKSGPLCIHPTARKSCRGSCSAVGAKLRVCTNYILRKSEITSTRLPCNFPRLRQRRQGHRAHDELAASPQYHIKPFGCMVLPDG